MYYILRFLQHACSVIKFVILTIVCRSKSASELMLHCYVYSTLNKSSMSMSKASIYNSTIWLQCSLQKNLKINTCGISLEVSLC